MSLIEIVVDGTLKPDGTLELDHKPGLSPGRVTIILRRESGSVPSPTAESPNENWWQFMQRARRELEASGAKFMNEEEVNAHIAWLREEDRIDELLSAADQQRQKPEHH
jgi:hypothetical protein